LVVDIIDWILETEQGFVGCWWIGRVLWLVFGLLGVLLLHCWGWVDLLNQNLFGHCKPNIKLYLTDSQLHLLNTNQPPFHPHCSPFSPFMASLSKAPSLTSFLLCDSLIPSISHFSFTTTLFGVGLLLNRCISGWRASLVSPDFCCWPS
jgi:hypothetical protein